MSKHQEALVLNHLKAGHTLTGLEAIDKFQCYRLSAVILRLRQGGHDIHTKYIPTRDNPKGYGEYHLIKEAGK